ncbi:MAG: tetratricopeptide repeat protein [Bacteroidota bacterium]
MDRTYTASVYLAFANHNKKKKGVQHLKSLYDSLAPILQLSERDQNISLIREDQDGIPFAHELLQGGLPLPGLTLVHLEADSLQSDEWLLNASGGKRLPIDWDSLFLDHLEDLKLIYLDKGASLDAVEKLLFAGAPAVIGTHFDFQDREAELFRSRFYAELSSGKTLQAAYEQAADAISRPCEMKKIPSDPYEYWESKEKNQNTTFHWGLYYLSANETILDWKMVSEGPAKLEAPIIPPPPPIEKPTVSLEEKLTTLPSSTQDEEEMELDLLAASLEKEEPLIELPQEEKKVEIQKEEKPLVTSTVFSHSTPAVGLKVKSADLEALTTFPPLKEVRIRETDIMYLQSSAFTDKEEKSTAAPVEDTFFSPPPVEDKSETAYVPPIENRFEPREEPIPVEEKAPIEKKIEIPTPNPQREEQRVRQSTDPNIVPLNRNPKIKEEPKEVVEENSFDYEPRVKEKEEERVEDYRRYQPTSLQTVEDKPSFLTARPKRKTINLAPLINSKPLIYTGIGLAVVGMILAAVFIFTGIDFDESWSNDQDSYLSAFGSGESYNILLLPFKEYPNCIAEDAFDEIAVRDRMNLFQEGEDLGIKVKFMGDGACPKNSEEARRIGQVYNADLVVWGNYPEIKRDSVNLHTRYISLRNNNNFLGSQVKNLGKLALGDNYDLQEGFIAGDIDDVVNWLLGIVNLRNENYISSLQFFEQMQLNDSHESANLYHLMAKCYQGLEQYDQVLQSYNQVIFLSPDNANAYHNRGLLYQHLKQEEQAIADFSEAIRLNPRHIKAHYNRNLLMEGEVDDTFYVDPELMQKTEDVWETTEEGDSDTFPDEEIQLVTETDRSGGFIEPTVMQEESEIEDLYEERGNRNLSSSETFFSDGLKLEQRGRLSDAVEAYNHAIETAPRESRYYHARAKVYEKIGKIKDALNDYTTASQLSPKNTEIYLNRAYLYERMHKYYEAIADYGKIINLAPTSPGAYLYRGKAYQFVKQPRKSLADFEKAISLNPNDATGFYFRALLYMELKKPNLAIDDFSHAIEINPGYASAYRQRGELYVGRSLYQKALEDFNKVLALNPRDANIYAKRAEMNYQLGNPSLAKKDIEQAVRLAPGNMTFKSLLAKFSK